MNKENSISVLIEIENGNPTGPFEYADESGNVKCSLNNLNDIRRLFDFINSNRSKEIEVVPYRSIPYELKNNGLKRSDLEKRRALIQQRLDELRSDITELSEDGKFTFYIIDGKLPDGRIMSAWNLDAIVTTDIGWEPLD